MLAWQSLNKFNLKNKILRRKAKAKTKTKDPKKSEQQQQQTDKLAMLLSRTQKRKFQTGKCIGNEEFAWSSLFEKQNLQAKTLVTQSVKTYCLQSRKSDDYLPNSLTARGTVWHTSQTTKTVNSFWEYVLSLFKNKLIQNKHNLKYLGISKNTYYWEKISSKRKANWRKIHHAEKTDSHLSIALKIKPSTLLKF